MDHINKHCPYLCNSSDYKLWKIVSWSDSKILKKPIQMTSKEKTNKKLIHDYIEKVVNTGKVNNIGN